MKSVGKYQVVKSLGKGGFGEVYLVKDKQGDACALKIFKPQSDTLSASQGSQESQSEALETRDQMRTRFINESIVLKKLSHNPYIVNFRDADQLEDGTPYYVMDYLEKSLSDRIGRDVFISSAIKDLPVHEQPSALPISIACIILEQLAQALAEVHEDGLIHRDVTPKNIMFDKVGKVQLCDFGIAKLPDAKVSHSNLLLGVRNYMSPEQRLHTKYVTPASDIYSVGVVAYRMLMGQLPEASSVEPKVTLPGMGQALNDLIMQCLKQGVTIGFGFDRGIAFDQVSEAGIILFAKP